jgi:hypothetical protein
LVKEVSEMRIRKRHFCPVVKDVVSVAGLCIHCRFWEGLHCSAGDLLGLTVKTTRASRVRFARRLRPRPLPRRQGRGLREPELREKWPVQRNEDPADEEQQNEYGIAGLLNDDGCQAPEPAEVDIPDSEVDEIVEPADVPLPEEPEPPILPPGPGAGPELDRPPDGMPGFPLEPSPPPDGPELDPFMLDNPPGTPPGLPGPPGMP